MKTLFALFCACLLIVAPARAQTPAPWGQPIGFSAPLNDLPQTPAIVLVKAALAQAKCEQAAVDYINAQHSVPAVVWPAGAGWPMQTIVWYGKGGDYCEGKFQYGGTDGPYTQGWEIKWDGSTFVDDPVYGKRHPTRFTIAPFGPVDTSIPVGPAPVVTPPATPPAPAGVDLTPRVTMLEMRLNDFQAEFDALAVRASELEARLVKLEADVTARLTALEAKPIPASCSASISLGATRIPISCKLGQ